MRAQAVHILPSSRVQYRATTRLLAALVLSVLSMLMLYSRNAEAQEPSECAVKAAFLYHFAQLTNWPVEALAERAPITFCTLYKDPLRGELEKVMTNRLIQDHRINIVHLKELASARTCNVLFVGSEQESQLPSVTGALRGTAVLLTGESPQALNVGVMIAFERQKDRLRFTVNTVAASRSGISFSSTLLSLASSIVKN